MKFLTLLIISLPIIHSTDVPIGTIVSDWSEYSGVFSAINIALAEQQKVNKNNVNRTLNPFQFRVFADRIKTVDAYKLSKLICRQVRFNS